MRTIETKVYTIDEMSEDLQEKAHTNYITSNRFEWAWTEENKAVLYAFADIFPVKINNWEYDNQSGFVSFEMTCDSDIEDLTGQRLATYLWNNYKRFLYKGKYYKTLSTDNKKVIHKRIKAELLSNGKWFNSYYSTIKLEENCLTGYCVGYDILRPIFKFLEKPYEIDFQELMDSCFDAWLKSVKGDLQSQLEFEYFKDLAEANNWEFDESGNLV